MLQNKVLQELTIFYNSGLTMKELSKTLKGQRVEFKQKDLTKLITNLSERGLVRTENDIIKIVKHKV